MIILTLIWIRYDNDDDKYYCKNNINTNSTDQKGGLTANEEKKGCISNKIIITAIAVAWTAHRI